MFQIWPLFYIFHHSFTRFRGHNDCEVKRKQHESKHMPTHSLSHIIIIRQSWSHKAAWIFFVLLYWTTRIKLSITSPGYICSVDLSSLCLLLYQHLTCRDCALSYRLSFHWYWFMCWLSVALQYFYLVLTYGDVNKLCITLHLKLIWAVLIYSKEEAMW